MLATLIIVFREVIEAGLVVGIVLAATRGVPARGAWISYGILAGIMGACLVAAFAGSISGAMEGTGQELFNVAVLLAAVLMLTWHNVWMARHGRDIALHVKNVGEAVAAGRRSLAALAVVVGLAVLREGSEVVLFLYGIALSGGDTAPAMAAGGALGLVFGVAVGAVTYLGLLKIPNRYLFTVTGWLIALLAAGMAAQAMAFLQQAQIITTFTPTVWNSSGFIADGSITGQMLHTLIGYTAQPTQLQVMAYIVTLAVIFALMRLFGHAPQHPKAAIAVILIAVIALSASPAKADFKIYSPKVEKGMLEFEARNRLDVDHDPGADRFRQHKLGVGYGFTDWWFSEVYAELEKSPGHGYAHTATEWENIIRFTEPGEHWLDAGLKVEYEFSHESRHADKLKSAMLLEKSIDKWTHTTNISLKREVGKYRSNDTELGVYWRSLYSYDRLINPGIEYYADFGATGHIGNFDDQQHRVGPVLFGNLGGGVKYELGWLVGLSRAAQDSTVKLNLEYEFPVQF